MYRHSGSSKQVDFEASKRETRSLLPCALPSQQSKGRSHCKHKKLSSAEPGQTPGRWRKDKTSTTRERRQRVNRVSFFAIKWVFIFYLIVIIPVFVLCIVSSCLWKILTYHNHYHCRKMGVRLKWPVSVFPFHGLKYIQIQITQTNYVNARRFHIYWFK